jgi:protocatechuate 3,4-dioxygenase beta subunit
MSRTARPSRREFLATTALSAAALTASELFSEAMAQAPLAPTPACGADAATRPQTEGPFYRPRSPERANLIEPGMKGMPVELTGAVLTRSCRPVVGAIVDLWHADDAGGYDNAGFRLRGHVLTDAAGRYRFRTIRPASYPGRTRHYHVKVQGGGRPALTTQLYFPDDPMNRTDPLYRRELLMKVTQAGDGLAARFDFVLDMR